MAMLWLFPLLGIALLLVAVHGQPSAQDFISIDCGIGSDNKYTDAITGIPYDSDDNFTDSGVNYQISSSYASSSLDKQLGTLRSFPNAARSCYVLPAALHRRYILRASFMYGNYDGQNSANTVNPLMFDLYIGVNFWERVRVTDPSSYSFVEAVILALSDSVSVCLADIGSGTPFVSSLEQRPLQSSMYPAVTSRQYLVLRYRNDVGTSLNRSLRYPDDPYDRLWVPWTLNKWTKMSTTETIKPFKGTDIFQPPMVIMQTAAAPISSNAMEFYWNSASAQVPSNEYYANFFFSELEANASRTFNVYLNGQIEADNYTAPYLTTDYIWTRSPIEPSDRYECNIVNSTSLSRLPPILNAFEAFTAMHLTKASTQSGDVDAINTIKKQYQLKRGWLGDPCAPGYAWGGLNCSNGPNSLSIISINLSSSALTGAISSSFAMLVDLEYLDLSYNNLTGPIPDALGTLSLLQVLNLAGNNLSGGIPESILRRTEQGTLTFRYDSNLLLCTSMSSCELKPKKKIPIVRIVIVCVVAVVLVLMLLAIFIIRLRRSKGARQGTGTSGIDVPDIDNSPKSGAGIQEKILQFANRQFTFRELENITNNFSNVIGKGGFGSVFLGYIEDGTPTAIKVLSKSSSQGTKEFLAEVQNLTKIHHKNLVSLVGYCVEGDHLALVYEFMSQGTLRDHLTDKDGKVTLSWGQRLRIVVETAEGLEYLHRGCKPPLSHRDVKSANILLSENLEAKIADFGLSRAFDKNRSVVSTLVVGTPGYLDPEYHSTSYLSEKSDVYSFGVVLFEVITGQLAIIVINNESDSLAQWARQMLSIGNIEDLIDPKLQGEYNVNSIWRVAELAFRCTEAEGRRRPSMSDVVMDLKESLTMEHASYKYNSSSINKNSNLHTETTPFYSQTIVAASIFEEENFHKFTPSIR